MSRTRLPLAALLLLSVGCTDKGAPNTGDSPSPSDSPLDTDTGTDTGTDTDTGTNTNITPYGPENVWYHAPDASMVPNEPAEDVWRTDALVPNLRFTDQNGDPVWLYQFYGQTIYLDWVAEWCGPCNDFAPYVDAFYQAHIDDAVILTVVVEDLSFAPGGADAVARWTTEHGSTNPVVWLNAEQLGRIFDISTYPSFSLIDAGLRLAHRDTYQLHDDYYRDQAADRMVLPIGGSTDNTTEVCDNGFDDDLDLVADCMDPACSGTAACTRAEVTGSVEPCTYDVENTPIDVWEVEVTGAVAAIEADNIRDNTGFENLLFAKLAGDDWSAARLVGDDEWACTWALEDAGCARGWLRPGTWHLAVGPGTGMDDHDGDCQNPALGEYVLRVDGDVRMVLIEDNLTAADFPGLVW